MLADSAGTHFFDVEIPQATWYDRVNASSVKRGSGTAHSNTDDFGIILKGDSHHKKGDAGGRFHHSKELPPTIRKQTRREGFQSNNVSYSPPKAIWTGGGTGWNRAEGAIGAGYRKLLHCRIVPTALRLSNSWACFWASRLPRVDQVTSKLASNSG